jgi:hypothetical protein
MRLAWNIGDILAIADFGSDLNVSSWLSPKEGRVPSDPAARARQDISGESGS